MIKLTIHARLLAQLKLAMPKTNKAELAIDKYVTALEELIDHALLYSDDNRYRFFNQFKISIHQFMLSTGQVRINGRKQYLHQWLKENKLELITLDEVGQKQADQKHNKSSIARLTHLVQMTDEFDSASLATQSVDQLIAYLNDKSLSTTAFMNRALPGYLSLSENAARSQYDFCEIDIHSLQQYIFWILNRSNKLNAVEKSKNLKTAEMILRISQFTNSILPQLKTSNFFGRHYYRGISVQSVHKSLRRAMLGNCWEYDIRSSVISWKLGFAQMLLNHEKSPQSVANEFGALLYYLSKKQQFTDYIRNHAFSSDFNGDDEYKNTKIKEALTAISFGARMSQRGWIDVSGKAFNPAMVSIIKNATARKRFIECDLVQAFKDEHIRLDHFIFSHFMRIDQSLSKQKELQSVSGRMSKSKVLAYLYQHAETYVMDVVRTELNSLGYQVIATVHDGIYTRERISTRDKKHIEQRMRFATNIDYWALKEERLKRYAGISDELKKEEVAHQQINPQKIYVFADHPS